MKKKFLSLLVAVCMFIPCLFMLTACGNKLEGTYTLHSVTIGETTWTKADYEEKKESTDLSEEEQDMLFAFGMNISIEIKDDGTCSYSMTFGEETETMDGTWTQDGDKVTITFDGDPQEFTYKDGKLSGSMDGMTMVLAKA